MAVQMAAACSALLSCLPLAVERRGHHDYPFAKPEHSRYTEGLLAAQRILQVSIDVMIIAKSPRLQSFLPTFLPSQQAGLVTARFTWQANLKLLPTVADGSDCVSCESALASAVDSDIYISRMPMPCTRLFSTKIEDDQSWNNAEETFPPWQVYICKDVLQRLQSTY